MRYAMRRIPLFYPLFAATAVLVLLPALAADSTNPALEVLAKAHEAGAQSQKRIDKLDDAMKHMRDEMREGALTLEALKSEQPELQRRAGAVATRRAQLEQEFSAGVPGQIDAQPAMQEMVHWLEQFVAADAPFRREERQQRVAGLRSLLEKENLSDADKLRAVLEVTQVELQYGRSVATYRGQLRFGDKEQEVEFLRVGRLMLYYLEPDGTRQGYWDGRQHRWRPLPAEERERLLTAMAMARGETSPELMELLLPAPEAGS